MKRWIVPAAGVLLVLIGAVWTLQGTGVLGGSSMTGSQLWTVIGLIAVVLGLVLVWRAVRVRRS